MALQEDDSNFFLALSNLCEYAGTPYDMHRGNYQNPLCSDDAVSFLVLNAPEPSLCKAIPLKTRLVISFAFCMHFFIPLFCDSCSELCY